MKVSVIIIGYNSWHYLEKCFASLSFLLNDETVEMIYVDNASVDGTLQNISACYPTIKTIANSSNKGIAVARNQGIRMAKGEYIWLLDSDTEVNETAFSVMLQFMESHKNTGMCACKLTGQDGKAQASCRRFPTVKGKLKTAVGIIFRQPHSVLQYDLDSNEAFQVDYVIGACQFIRKEVFEKTGLLDEQIFYGPEDADLCLRMQQTDYNVFYLPQVSIYHAYQRISSYKLFSKINQKHIAGLGYYFWKHWKRVVF